MNNFVQTYTEKVSLGELTEDPAQTAVLPEFDRIQKALSVPVKRSWFSKPLPPPKGLYLWGGVGRGKSMMMDLFVDSLGLPCRRVHFHAFMQEIHAALHRARKSGAEDALAPVAEAVATDIRLLAFDEMQITDITDAMIVGRLFEKLFAAGIVVVTTSNRAPSELYKNGINRQLFLPFIQLIEEKLVLHEMVSPTDYRQNRLFGSPVYFTPNDSAAQSQMEQIWRDLTAGASAPLTLLVQGRQVILPGYHNGVGRVRFFDLCGQPLGAADYLAVAEAVRVLLLEDVPQLGRSNFNEAKRFVTLIDALYEARVRLICSAAARPEMLYLEGEGTFEFERTASRLCEMQSEEWAG